MTEGQRQALRQLRAVAAVDPAALEIVRVTEPAEDRPRLLVEMSVNCAGIEHRPGGVHLNERERLRIYVDPDFPWDYPAVYTTHNRWAGTPHVQWGNYLCLYQAPAVEWQPQDGMFGFLERVELWLSRAAAGELDPIGGPLHPPAVYTSADAPMLVVHADTPAVHDAPWIGFALLRRSCARRMDLVGWTEELGGDSKDVAPALLMPTPMDWEYPRTVRELLDALATRGVPWQPLLALLRLGSVRRPKDAGMPLIIGTPMRRVAEGPPQQHLGAWYLSETLAEGLRLSILKLSEDAREREMGGELERLILAWADDASAAWCHVEELRPQVTERRDATSPLHRAFAGKTVAIWGCGAIGAHAAEWIARAGVDKLLLYDRSSVTPGVLTRQPYSDGDVGRPKATVLAERLRTLLPALDVEGHVENVLKVRLKRSDWHDDADIVLDATASVAVASKLEAARRREGAGTATLVTMLLGHTAEHGIVAIAPPKHSGAGADVLRRTKLACTSRPGLGGFANEFWPDPPRTEHFQPEPGCSDATFRGSGAEVAALTGTLLTCAAADLAAMDGQASAHLAAVPTAEHVGRRQAELVWSADLVLEDGLGRYQIRVSQPALEAIRAWTARNDRVADSRSETGGVLFGQRDAAAGVLWIDEVSGPPPDSVASPEEFACGVTGLDEMQEEKRNRSRGSLAFVGMWHTHPDGRALPSPRDVGSMARLVFHEPLPEVLMLIAASDSQGGELGAYVFAREELPQPFGTLVIHPRPVPDPPSSVRPRTVGLALSGGGLRAIAFHLGCLRAMHDRGVLDRVRVISGVSGGAIASAVYAYSLDTFADFDARLRDLLRRGLQREIARRAILRPRAAAALGSRLAAGTAAMGAKSMARIRRKRDIQPPLRRWVSRTDAFEATLAARLFDSAPLTAPRRDNIDVVINACDLRTGSAVRFGSRESGIWRLGRMVEPVAVATAVAASAAYPLLLPALDRRYEFERRDGTRRPERVVLTDGGVFDNLGTSCLEPGRSEQHSYNVFQVNYIVACDAGRGLLADAFPVGPIARLARAFEATHRKVQDAGRGRLHRHVTNGELQGFVMPYLGQQDRSLPYVPADLVPRARVASYPTNFAAMPQLELEALTLRGEQLTHILIDRWCPEL